MERYLFLLLTIVTCTVSYSQRKANAKLQPEQVIALAFEALSNADITKMEQAVTDDVKILEHGVVWTLDTVRAYLRKARPADFKRINSFEFFQSEISGNMAFVSYHNRAEIHANNKDRTVKWLESAVLIKQDNTWRIKMLHSTRLE